MPECKAIRPLLAQRPDARSPEVSAAISDFHRSIADAKGRNRAGGARGGNARLPLRQSAVAGSSIFAPLALVPWWGWVIVLLHLAYRINKVRDRLGVKKTPGNELITKVLHN